MSAIALPLPHPRLWRGGIDRQTLLDQYKHAMIDPIKWTDEAARWEKVWNELFLK